MKVLRYLQGTKDHMLTYRRSDHLDVIEYSDSDYAGCVDTRKSTFVYLFLLAGGAILWKSAMQYVIAHPLWKLSLWHALRPQFKLIGCETLFQNLD